MKQLPSTIRTRIIAGWPLGRLMKAAACLLFVAASAVTVFGQNDPEPVNRAGNRDFRDPTAVTLRDMVVKQQINQRKKEYDELLKRGDEALKLSEELNSSLENNKEFDSKDIDRLQSLEKIVEKIRDDLGGKDSTDEIEGSEKEGPSDLVSAFKKLRDNTVKLVDELKKTSRFSISVVAIETSNSVIWLARFLRLRQ